MKSTQKIVLLFFFTLFLNSTELKIASYNVENLFDMHYDGSEYSSYHPHKHNWTETTLKKKLTNISEVICDIDADIIALQEIENRNTLRLLQKSLRRYGCPYRYSAITKKERASIGVALLSKLPIQNSRDIVVNRRLGQRNILEVIVTIDTHRLYLFVNHWNSKKSPESKRIVSARALKKRLLELPKGSEYILLGDFNSNYNEYQTIEPKHNDSHGRTGINHILKTTENGDMIQEIDMKDEAFRHYNLWLELPKFGRWSHDFYGKKQGLDAILLPYSLFDGKGIDYINNSFSVFKKPYLFHKKGYIYRWEYKKKRHIGRGYSDHLPIVASFSTEPYYFENIDSVIKDGKIKDLYENNSLLPLYLKGVKVILKRGYHAIIKQSKDGRAIFVYGAGSRLKEGEEYDMVVLKTEQYHGLDEIVEFDIKKEYGVVDIEPYIHNRELYFIENEVLQNIEGIYRDKFFYIDKKSYPIYFKKRKFKLKNGSKLRLNRVQVGYYNRLQFVVWDKEDFEVISNSN